MGRIDWRAAGERIRFQPKDQFGKNPDWDWVNQRWKDEADYYGEELAPVAVVGAADCPLCKRPIGEACVTARGEPMTPHAARVRAAGGIMLEAYGPRFTQRKGRAIEHPET